MKEENSISRRDFIQLSAAAAVGASVLSSADCSAARVAAPMLRKFGKTNLSVTTMGLGGQGAIQWTPEGVDPASIILKAFDLGINFFDTSNMYGPSQRNYNKAFRKLNLVPGEEGYNSELRKSFYLTSKTLMRWGKPGWTEMEGVRNSSNGEQVKCAVDDLKRSMSQLFGDGNGGYPEGAYLDLMLIHSITSFEEVDVLYKGLETPLDPDGNFGALIALRDFRDGTNLTGMNPGNEKLIRHIGFSGHHNPAVMIDMIQRDEFDLLEAMLVSINSNDRLYFDMQDNVIPVAKAKGLGVIGMKVFADAVMYDKEARFSKTPQDVYRKVGSPSLPSKPLIQYVLSLPGVDTLIIGIGNIDKDPRKCQLTQNLDASQIEPGALSEEERLRIEAMTARVGGGRTNYFQLEKNALCSPREIKAETIGDRTRITWQTAYAAGAPISHYEVLLNNRKIGEVKHAPQILKSRPFAFETAKADEGTLLICAVDSEGNRSFEPEDEEISGVNSNSSN